MAKEGKNIQTLIKNQFPGFEEDLVSEIVRFGEVLVLGPDALMIDVGEKVEIIPLIVSGQVKVFREDEQDHELFMYFLGPGEACAITLICSAREGYSKIKAIPEEITTVVALPIGKLDEWMIK